METKKLEAKDLLLDGYHTLDKEVVTLALDRAEVCIKCPNLSKVDLNCIKCSCDFKSKLLTISKQCPINKW